MSWGARVVECKRLRRIARQHLALQPGPCHRPGSGRHLVLTLLTRGVPDRTGRIDPSEPANLKPASRPHPLVAETATSCACFRIRTSTLENALDVVTQRLAGHTGRRHTASVLSAGQRRPHRRRRTIDLRAAAAVRQRRRFPGARARTGNGLAACSHGWRRRRHALHRPGCARTGQRQAGTQHPLQPVAGTATSRQ